MMFGIVVCDDSVIDVACEDGELAEKISCLRKVEKLLASMMLWIRSQRRKRRRRRRGRRRGRRRSRLFEFFAVLFVLIIDQIDTNKTATNDKVEGGIDGFRGL